MSRTGVSGMQRRALLDASTDSSRRPTKAGIYLLLVASVLILGLNWPILVVGLRSVSPIWMVALRVGGTALVMGGVGVATGNMQLPPRHDRGMIVVVAVFRLAVLMALVFFGLTLVPAGRSSVLVWTASLWTVPIAAIVLKERMTRNRWIGLLIGLVGVVILSEAYTNDWGRRDVLLGTGLLLSGAVLNASTSVYIRRHRWVMNPLQALPWQMGGAAIPLTVAGLVVDGPPAIQWSWSLVLVLLYQSVMASGLAFWAQIVVLRNLSAVSANLTMMGVPVVGVVSSAVFLGEAITPPLLVGMVLVMIGVTINLLSDGSRRTVESE